MHVNFCAEDEVDALLEVGFLQRKGVQFHFTNYKKGGEAIARLEARIKRGDTLFDGRETHHNEQYAYADFEDYLSEFKSKRRITMRRERTIVREQSGLEIQVLCGHEISEQLMVEMFDIYKSTIDKQFYGRQYLSRQFFKSLSECEDFKKCICVVVARAKDDGRLVGGTFNIVGRGDEQGNGGIFYGRYWGCVEEFKHLHFEACYYAAIEYCIDNGLSRMEPGAGGGDFKYMRGFEPSVTFSMHYLRDERLSHAIARYLDVETYHIEGAVSQMKMESAVRSKARLSASHLQQEE